MKRLGLILLAMAGLCLSCEPEVVEEDHEPVIIEPHPGGYLLPIVETTDMHGYIIDDGGSTLSYNLAYIADKVNNLSRNDRDRILLLDGGDLYQGAAISNLLEGRPVYTAVDMMHYDAVALGNHEFDWGLESLTDADATLPDYDWDGEHIVSTVPVVCSNIYLDGSRISRTKDYVIVSKKAFNNHGDSLWVNIGIIGFAPDYSGSIMTSKFTGAGYSIKEDYSIPNRIAAELESSGQCDLTILLTHGSSGEAARMLGRDTPIELVFGGHTHRADYGSYPYHDLPLVYLQAGRHCENYAYAEFGLSTDTDGKVVVSGVQGESPVNFKSLPRNASFADYGPSSGNGMDPVVKAVCEQAVEEASEQMNDVIGYIDVSASTYYISGSDSRASAMSNWMCDILRRVGGADVAFVNGGGVRSSITLAGGRTRDITVSNVYEMFPFNNTTYIYDLSYQELLSVYTYSLTTGGKALFTNATGIDCRFSGSTVNSLTRDGTVIYKDGKWTGDWASRRVMLAVSEYLATTERTDYYTRIANPLIEWNSTSRLLDNHLVDNVSAIAVLREEAAASGGLLKVDTAAHFIEEN